MLCNFSTSSFFLCFLQAFFKGSRKAFVYTIYSVQFSSVAQSCLTLCDPMNRSMPGLPVYHQLLEFTQTHVHRAGDAILPSHPLLSPSPPTFNFPSISVFFNESFLQIRWPKYWSSSFSISPSNEHPGLISFRMDWLDLLQSKGLSRVFSNTTVQKHQLSAIPALISTHDHWKNHSFIRCTFVGKVTSLLFNMLSRLFIAFLRGASIF